MIIFNRVAILGAGLLGASLAKALKKRKLVNRVSVWSRSEGTRQKCRLLTDVFDEVCQSPQEAVADADAVVICVPTENIAEIASEISQGLKEGSIVTDVGSVKGVICRDCLEALSGSPAEFVGSHPMAGSEKIGVDYSEADLFENRPCFVVADEITPAAEAISMMWKGVGMRVYGVSAREHDAIVARISHLVHLVAGTLCLTVAGYKRDLRPFSGPGFRDTTRVVSGSPEIWDSIIADNQTEILSALNEFKGSLDELIAAVENLDKPVIAARLRRAKQYRDEMK